MNPSKRAQKLGQAHQAAARGDAAGAEALCRLLLRTNRADVPALHLLGVLCAARHDYAAATEHFGRCALLDAGRSAYHNDLARVHALAGRHAAAIASFETAARLQPADARVATNLADVLERAGQHERARALLAPFVDTGRVDEDMALVLMRLLDAAGDTGAAITLARTRVAGSGSSVSSSSSGSSAALTRRLLLQLLGRLYEKTGDFAAAFQAFADAQRGQPNNFEPLAYARQIDELKRCFAKPALAHLRQARTDADETELPLVIACMPRSGSTLVEQMIHAHPLAFGSGEHALLHEAVTTLAAEGGGTLAWPHSVLALDAPRLQALAAQRLRVLRELAPGAARISNKHLLNWLHLGLWALLFPHARVVHLRRARLDNAFACFMSALPPALAPWASDLRHIGLAWREYERLMQFWRDTLQIEWLELDYESLVQDTEAQVRRLIGFCGLPWDARCLRYWEAGEAEHVVLTPSYDQVRRPIFHSALGRAQKYDAFLGPLKEALG